MPVPQRWSPRWPARRPWLSGAPAGGRPLSRTSPSARRAWLRRHGHRERRLPRHHLGRAPLLPARRRRSQRRGEPHRVAGPAGRSAPSRSGPWRRPSGAPRSPRSRGPAPGRGPPTAPSGRRRRPGSRRPTAGGHRRLRRDAPRRPPARRGRVGVRAGARSRGGRRGRAATGGGPGSGGLRAFPRGGSPRRAGEARPPVRRRRRDRPRLPGGQRRPHPVAVALLRSPGPPMACPCSR